MRGSDRLFARRRVLDAPGFFGKIDVFALHAEEELVPISLVEALSCGCASVVADRGDVAQLVGADAALFTRPGDVDAVVEALDRLGDPVNGAPWKRSLESARSSGTASDDSARRPSRPTVEAQATRPSAAAPARRP